MFRVVAAAGTPQASGNQRSQNTRYQNNKERELLKELVAANPEEKNWKGIGIALVVIIIVLSLVITATILVTPAEIAADLGTPFSFKSFMDASLVPRELEANWVGPDTYVHRDGEGAVVAVNIAENKTTFIMDNTTFRQLNTERYWVSADLKYVLLAYNIAKMNRHTKYSFYKIYDTQARKLNNLPANNEPQGTGAQGGAEEALLHACWGPTGNSLAYVYKNTLYYQASTFTPAQNLTPTDDPNYIYNAIPDWLYEEEILSGDHAYWWSPTGAYIAYARISDELVPQYLYPQYGDQVNIAGLLNTVRYPKAGDQSRNPTVQLYVTSLTGDPVGRKVLLLPPAPIAKTEHYLVEVTWKDASKLAVTWLNRAQNLSMIVICDATSGACVNNLKETTKDGAIAWLEMEQSLVFTPRDGRNYFLILPQQDGVAGYYQHVAMVTANTNQEGQRSFLTHGQWDVMEIVGYDSKENDVYFIGTWDNPLKRRLLKVGTLASKTPKQVTCLSCDYNETCEFVTVKFSPSGRYYFMSCQGPGIPSHYVRSTADPSFNVTLDDNADVAGRLHKLAMPVREYHTVTLANKRNTSMQIFLPPVLNKEHVIKYPVLLYVYAGPNSQMVNYKYTSAFTAYFTSGQAMVVASMDGRGTKARGNQFKHDLYKNMATVEVDDQITAIEYLRTLSYVDVDNIAVHGWSYGGFVTGHIVRRGTGLVHCALLGAPVTDFRYYDTYYTEKYMGFPTVEDNLNGYVATSLMDDVEGFRKTKTMIIHGTGDDNVHFQNTAHLTKRLIEKGVDFSTQIYPDERHTFTLPSMKHFIVTMTNFLNNCYKNVTVDYVTNPPIREPEKEKDEQSSEKDS